jgi:hypothetical protein
MPPPPGGGQRAKKANDADVSAAAATAAAAASAAAASAAAAEREERAVAAEADAAAALTDGVTALFRHGGEEQGGVPLRNVYFAKNLLTRNGFMSAVEQLDTQSLDALLPCVERVVEQVRQVQVEDSFDMFDDLLRRLEELNYSAAHSAASIAAAAAGYGANAAAAAGFSPDVAAPDDLVNLLAVGVLCARVCKGGYKLRRSLPTRVTHALIAAMSNAPERFGVVGRAVVEASLGRALCSC